MRSTNDDRPSSYRLGRAAPGAPVRDIETALAFYVGVLGMTETFRNGDPVGFVIVERDDAEIHLILQPAHRATTANVLHLMVDDADAFHAHVQSNGVRIVKGIRDADYRMRTFVMADPSAIGSMSAKTSDPPYRAAHRRQMPSPHPLIAV